MPSKDETASLEINPIKAEIDEIKRRRILDESLSQFFEKGYEATSLETIAEVLGVTKQCSPSAPMAQN